MVSGPLRENVVPASPVGPPVSLLDAAVRPGPGEVGLDGRPMAITTEVAGTGTVTRGYRWEGGFKWRPRQCGPFGGRNDCAPVVAVGYDTDTDGGIRQHMPTIITAEYDCTGISVDWEFYRRSAIEALIAAEPKAAERELWEGTLARAAIAAGDHSYDDNLYLTKHGVATDLTPTPGTGVSPQRGLGILEDFLADLGYGGLGTIHFRPSISAHLPWDIRPNGPRLFSPRNTLLVPGSGYTGSGPATVADGAPTAAGSGKTWMYATGVITYRQGEIQVIPDDAAQALDRAVNDVAIYAQRSSAATWESCAVGAVLVSYPA